MTRNPPLDELAIGRTRELMAQEGVAGLVLTTPGMVAWATAGLNVPIDRSAAVDTVWVAIGMDAAAIVTTTVEGPRIGAENAFGDRCLLVTAPWWDEDGLPTAAARALAAAPASLASDGHPAFGRDLSFELTRARLALSPREQSAITELGRLAAGAVEDSLRQWRPGETDRAIAARVASRVEEFGGQAPVLLVGGDQRVRAYRHPVAVGDPVHSLAMAVLVASRGGLHVALTRYASAGPVDPELAEGLSSARAIHASVLSGCRDDGAAVGDLMGLLDAAYTTAGHAGAWREHYQGGPIGYAQRECEIAPGQYDSPWWPVHLPVGCAVAWNPSVPGGAKDEDTYLITPTGPECITATGRWPSTEDAGIPRPAVLDIND